MDKNFIGERISELRLKKNVSEYQMSLDLGKNKSYIQSLTSGRSLPTMQSFLDICDYLEVTPQQFFQFVNVGAFKRFVDERNRGSHAKYRIY